MNTVFFIDGGAGRVITAIPALEHYVKSNPNENIKIFVYGWDNLFWSNRLLQPLSFSVNDKGNFQKIFKEADKILSPEPYRLPEYINQRASLAEAFDILINGKNNNLGPPRLNLSKQEIYSAKKYIENIKNKNKKNKVIVIQPFGSTAFYDSVNGSDYVIDPSYRSMDLMMFSKIVKYLSEKYNVVLFSDEKFHFKEDNCTIKLNGDLRMYASIINQCDYFIGCDSVGQHMARAFDKPGTVVFGSTFPENVSYPDWFQIVDKNKELRVYSPLRINDIDCNMADRMNEDCMNYSEKEIDDIIISIDERIKK